MSQVRSVAVLTALVASTAHAGQPLAQEGRGGASVVVGHEDKRIEHQGMNDSMVLIDPSDGLPHDRWFTSSTQLRGRLALDPSLTSALPMPHRAFVAASLGMNMYTPRTASIATPDELDGDRPYSGWTAASVGGELVLRGSPFASAAVTSSLAYTHVGVEVYVGASGPWSFAGETQHVAHEAWRLTRGMAIPEIVGYGVAETAGRVAVDVDAFVDTSLVAWRLPNSPSFFGAQPTLHVRPGFRLDAGVMLDAAAINTTVMFGFMHDAVAPTNDGSIPVALYFAVRPELRAVLFNETIDGVLVDGTTRASSTPMVAELVTSLVARVWFVEISANVVGRTNEVASLSPTLLAQTSPSLTQGQWYLQWSAAAVW